MESVSAKPDLAHDILEYTYQPLDRPGVIRVLTIQPADDFKTPLRCHFDLHSLTTGLLGDYHQSYAEYAAVSYTWGDARPSCRLLIASSEPGPDSKEVRPLSFLRITPNIVSFLRHFRRVHKPVRLWIDAVCLNQRDEHEKAQQIPMMGAIYKAARRVHVWLGDEDVGRAQRAFQLIRRIDLVTEPSLSADEHTCLAALFSRRWFTRRWIVQEAVLAHEAVLHCGVHSLGLSWVVSALRRIQDRSLSNGEDLLCRIDGGVDFDILGYGPRMLLSSVAAYQEAPTRLRLLKLLWDLHQSECSDTRDRIAALYGMASVASRPPVLKYNEGFRRMCWHTAAYFVNRDTLSAHVMLLHVMDFGPLSTYATEDDMPSWVPDWSSTRRHLVRCMFGRHQDIFRPLSNRTLHYRMDDWRFIRADMSGSPRPNSLKRQRSGWLEYWRGFRHPTQMAVIGNVLRIEAHPKLFSVFGGVVEKVYTFPSSWVELAVSLFETDDFGSRTYNILYAACTLLDKTSCHLEGRSTAHDRNPIRTALEEARHGTGEGRELPTETREGLQKLIVVLSRFSLIRNRRNWHPSLSEVCLAPRGVAVGDFLVPLVICEREEDDEYASSPNKSHDLSVLLCLRPVVSKVQAQDVTVPIEEKEFDPGLPFRHAVRWQGLAVHDKRDEDRWGVSGKHETPQRVFQAFCKAMDQGLPGPYVFDVV